MKVTVSDKYQVVIPKAVRKKAGISAGQKVTVSTNKKGNIVIEKDKVAELDRIIMKYAGVARGAWGPDPVATIRKMRDEEWD